MATLRERYIKAMIILRGLEFVQPMYNGNPECPVCGGRKHWAGGIDKEISDIDKHGHYKHCELAALIYARGGQA